MIKRILFLEVLEENLAEASYRLEGLIEKSKDIDLFESDVYLKEFSGKLMLGLSIIGIDGELFEHVTQKDLEIVNMGNEIHSFLKDFDTRKAAEKDQILIIDRDFETFRVGQFQIISDQFIRYCNIYPSDDKYVLGK